MIPDLMGGTAVDKAKHVALHVMLLLKKAALRNSKVLLPSPGREAEVHLDDIFTELLYVDHAELVKAGSDAYEQLLARTKESVAAGAGGIQLRGEDGTALYTLIEGGAGSGKTTLLKKLLLDWARNTGAAARYKFVFNIPIRTVQNVKAYQDIPANDLQELLHKYCLGGSDKMTPDELQEILGADTTKVLVVLDGLDEYVGGKLPVLDQLLDPSSDEEVPWHTGCGLLVTSRPAAKAIARARERSDSNYELVGFAPEDMEEFIRKCIALNTAKSGADAIRRVGSSWQDDKPDADTAGKAKRLKVGTAPRAAHLAEMKEIHAALMNEMLHGAALHTHDFGEPAGGGGGGGGLLLVSSCRFY